MSGVVRPGGGEEEFRQKLRSRGPYILLARTFRGVRSENIRPAAEGLRHDALDRFCGGEVERVLRKIRHHEPSQGRDAHGGDQGLVGVLRLALRLHSQQLRLCGGLARLRHFNDGTDAMGMTLLGGEFDVLGILERACRGLDAGLSPLALRNRRGSRDG